MIFLKNKTEEHDPLFKDIFFSVKKTLQITLLCSKHVFS